MRVRLASDDGRFSTTYSFFTGKKSADLYVTPMLLGGDVKISLHASGSDQVGFTGEASKDLWVHEDTRHWEIWKRPQPMHRDVVRAWYLLLPDCELRAMPPDPKAVAIPPVGIGYASCLEVLLLDNEGPTVRFESSVIVARMLLADSSQSALLVSRRVPWGPEQLAMADQWRATAHARAMEQGATTFDEHRRFFLHGNHETGTRFGIELAVLE